MGSHTRSSRSAWRVSGVPRRTSGTCTDATATSTTSRWSWQKRCGKFCNVFMKNSFISLHCWNLKSFLSKKLHLYNKCRLYFYLLLLVSCLYVIMIYWCSIRLFKLIHVDRFLQSINKLFFMSVLVLLLLKMLGLYLLGQNCLHLTFEQYLSSETYSRKYEKLPNIVNCCSCM